MPGESSDSPERVNSPEPVNSPERVSSTGRVERRLRHLGVAAVVLAFSFVFFKNAWVDEDAYITFRSIEQLFGGNGLRWNPHERVQAFTHPLWLAALSLLRLLSRDLFAAAILASYVCCLAMLIGLRRTLASPQRWTLLMLLLVSSKSFFDFTSSGLEGPLSYALLSFYLLLFFRIAASSEPVSPRDPALLSLLLGLLLLTRHDLLLLVGPAHVVALQRFRHLGLRRLSQALVLGLSPFLAWTLFSLVYYGFPLPNTAYAKLGTGIASELLLRQGLNYVASLLQDDPLVLLALAGALALALEPDARGARALALGIGLTALYVVCVGGDYMTGRFFGASYLVAAVCLMRRFELPRPAWLGLVAAALIYACLLPGSPIKSWTDYTSERPNEYGVGDQRGLLFKTSSLQRWLGRDPSAPFPDHRWSREGRALASAPEQVVARANIGFMGYHAGTAKIIVDRLALSDPLLARLPSLPIWRIGHFPRRVPAGYLESIPLEEGSQIEDPALRAYHARLRIVTEGPIFSSERLRAIVRLNLDLRRAPVPARRS